MTALLHELRRPLTIGSLFSGIGGLELGLERAGLGPVMWQVERDEWCRSILAKHWPNAKRFADVCEVSGAQLERVDVVCGGFPCQDISSAGTAGNRAGLRGPKSGLWKHMLRIVAELRPRWVVVENVADWRRWTPEVCVDLWSSGYCARFFEMDAASVGAPHHRPRVFAVAHAYGEGQCPSAIDAQVAVVREASGARRDWGPAPPGGWRVDDGVPCGVDRSRALGNAVVPQVAEVIGRALMATMEAA